MQTCVMISAYNSDSACFKVNRRSFYRLWIINVLIWNLMESRMLYNGILIQLFQFLTCWNLHISEIRRKPSHLYKLSFNDKILWLTVWYQFFFKSRNKSEMKLPSSNSSNHFYKCRLNVVMLAVCIKLKI